LLLGGRCVRIDRSLRLDMEAGISLTDGGRRGASRPSGTVDRSQFGSSWNWTARVLRWPCVASRRSTGRTPEEARTGGRRRSIEIRGGTALDVAWEDGADLSAPGLSPEFAGMVAD